MPDTPLAMNGGSVSDFPSTEPVEFWVVGLYHPSAPLSLLNEAWDAVRRARVRRLKPGKRLFTFVLDRGDPSPLDLPSHRWDRLNLRKLDIEAWEWYIWFGQWMYGGPGPADEEDDLAGGVVDGAGGSAGGAGRVVQRVAAERVAEMGLSGS